MKTPNYLLVAPILLSALQSCQKDTVKASVKHTSLIVGKWVVAQKHTRVYNVEDNTLLKDTTIFYGEAETMAAPWFESYDANGNAYITSKPYTIAGAQRVDTTAFMRYTIEGSHLTLKPVSGGTQTKPILKLTETDLNLESTYTGPTPGFRWGLDFETTYLFRDEVTYKKQ